MGKLLPPFFLARLTIGNNLSLRTHGIEGIERLLKKSTITEEVQVQTTNTPQPDVVQTTSSDALSTSQKLRAIFKTMRPRQWTKNLTVFIGIVFAQQLFSAPSLLRTILAFATFCVASSIIYILNDILDLENDRQHPKKRFRPLASGQLPISWAITAIGVLLVVCIGLTTSIFFEPIGVQRDIYAPYGGANVLFALTIASYLVMMVFYSTRLKHVVLIDVFLIAAGFVLRIMAGAVVIPVSISPWLYLVACLLSLFLALSKRLNELVLLQGQASNHRKILKEAYGLYTVQGTTGNHRLIVTIPLVLYGIFRYLYLVYMRMEGGSPEEVLLRDRHMLGTVILCTALIFVILYVLPQS